MHFLQSMLKYQNVAKMNHRYQYVKKVKLKAYVSRVVGFRGKEIEVDLPGVDDVL